MTKDDDLIEARNLADRLGKALSEIESLLHGNEFAVLDGPESVYDIIEDWKNRSWARDDKVYPSDSDIRSFT